MKNNEGYDITFKCEICGKEFELKNMHYNDSTKTRVCDNCFKEYRENQLKNK